MKNEKLIVALDIPSLSEAEKLVKLLSPLVAVFKVGKELFTSAGPSVIEMVHSHQSEVFLDLKFHDIPNTVGSACEAAVRHKVFMLNVHSLGGQNMMIQAVQSVHKTSEELKIKPPYVLGVTVLTSMKDNDLQEIGITKKLEKQVVNLAVLAKNCGLDGVVASAQEIGSIRKKSGKGFFFARPLVLVYVIVSVSSEFPGSAASISISLKTNCSAGISTTRSDFEPKRSLVASLYIAL